MVSVILVLCLVGVLIASPFGIFFSSGSSSPDAATPSAAVVQINGELSDYLATLQAGGSYDQVEILGQPSAWTETALKITITPRTPDDMRVFYSFTDAQNQALDALLANGGLLATLAGDLTISRQDAKALLAALPADLDPERRAVVETACQLVGKVNYFWGGKSRVLGWDERWGQIKADLLPSHGPIITIES